MAWIDGTASIYNTYQDLRLLEPKTPNLSLTDSSNLHSPGITKSGLLNTEIKVVIKGEKELPPTPKIRIEEANSTTDDLKEINSKGHRKSHSGSNIEVDGLSVENNTSNFKIPTKNRTRRSSSSIAGTFNIKPLPSVQNPHLAQMVQPFMSVSKNLPLDRGILAIQLSPDHNFWVAVTLSSVEVWSNKPTMLIAQITRSTDSVVSQGSNTDVSWKSDSKSFCTFTARGFVYFYDLICRDQITIPQTRVGLEEDEMNQLNANLSNHIHNASITNPHNWWIRNPGKFFDLKLDLVISIDSGIRCFMGLGDEILIATQKNASVSNYGWKEKIMLSSMHMSHDAPFLDPSNVMVNQMVFDSLQKVFGWMTTDGSVYIVKRKVELNVFNTISPYEWTGVQCHKCDGRPETYATFISINPNFNMIAAAMRNNSIHFYSYGKNGATIKFAYKVEISAPVTCIAWSHSGQHLAVATSTKGLVMYSIYRKLPELVAFDGRYGFGKSRTLSSNEDPYTECVHWVAWNSNDLELITVSNSDDSHKGKLFVMPITQLASSTQHTDDNIKHPTLFTSDKITLDFFIQTDQGSINPNSLAHTSQIPYIYAMDNFPIRYVSRSTDGLYLAISGQKGLAHYSCLSRKWKLFNNHSQEQGMTVVGGMVWFRHTLIVGCKISSFSRFQVKFYPRDKNLDHSNSVYTLELVARPIYLNLVGNWLLVYTGDSLLNFYEIIADPSGRVVNVVIAHKISLEGVVKVPKTIRAVSWFPGNIRATFPKMLVSAAGNLLLFSPEMDEENSQPRYKIFQIADKVSHFQLLDLPLAGVHFTLWAYCQGEVKLWYQLPDLPYLSDGDSSEPASNLPSQFRQIQTFNLPFFPVRLDLKQGIIFGIEQSMFESLTLPGVQFGPGYKSHAIFYQLLDQLISKGYDQEAYLFALNFEPYPYFAYGLEILLHDVLIRECEMDPKPEPDFQGQLHKAVNLIRQFPHFAEVVVHCARKIEMALWTQLFHTVGSPLVLFEHCMACNKLATASSYLIILHTLETDGVAFEASSKLLGLIIRAQDMDLFHSVARFMWRIKGQHDDKQFLWAYIQNQQEDDVEDEDIQSPTSP